MLQRYVVLSFMALLIATSTLALVAIPVAAESTVALTATKYDITVGETIQLVATLTPVPLQGDTGVSLTISDLNKSQSLMVSAPMSASGSATFTYQGVKPGTATFKANYGGAESNIVIVTVKAAGDTGATPPAQTPVAPPSGGGISGVQAPNTPNSNGGRPSPDNTISSNSTSGASDVASKLVGRSLPPWLWIAIIAVVILVIFVVIVAAVGSRGSDDDDDDDDRRYRERKRRRY